MPNLPGNVGLGLIVWRVLIASEDRDDVDREPEGDSPGDLEATVTLTATVVSLLDITASPDPVTILPAPITLGFDPDGYLVGQDGERGVNVVATDDPDLNPLDWMYRVDVSIPGYPIPPYYISVPRNTTVDLSTVIPIDIPGDVVATIVGPQGPQGIQGIQGPIGEVSDAELAGAIAASAATKMDKGSLVFSVKDFGAVGSVVAPAGNDAPAINAAVAAALAAGNGSRVLFPVLSTALAGYRVTTPIVIPDGVEVDMRAALIYAGPNGQTALTIGSGARENRRKNVIRVTRETLSDWSSELDIGVKINSQNYGVIDIVQASKFTIGAQLIGVSPNGVSYCIVNLGVLGDNKIGLDLTNSGGGWCNENIFFGGSFTVASTTNITLDRIGIRITSADGVYPNNNNNVFHKPSMEIKGDGAAFEGLPMLITHGIKNAVYDARHESPDTVTLRTTGASADNYYHVGYVAVGFVLSVDDQGTFPSSVLRANNRRSTAESTNIIRSHKDLHRKAIFADGAAKVNIPGLTVCTSATTLTEGYAVGSVTSIVMAADYLEVVSSIAIGFYVDTRVIKRFAINRDFDAGFGGRVTVRAYDSAGAVLTSAGPGHPYVQGSAALSYATTFGGSYRTGVDATQASWIAVGPLVDHMFIGVGGGTAVLRFRGLHLRTWQEGLANTYLAQPFADNDNNYGTAAPTAGTWTVGRKIYNAVPAASGFEGWVCTTAGTPGTWKTFGPISA